MSDEDRLFNELQALASLELELDRLVVEKVKEARAAGMSWDRVAEASGVSRPSAWRRWKEVVADNSDPRPTRQKRNEAIQRPLDPEAIRAGQQLTTVLAARLAKQPDHHPWFKAVRSALDRLSLKYEMRKRSPEEVEYEVSEKRLQINCFEPGSGSPGGLVGYIFPSPELVLKGESHPRTFRFAPDGSELPIDEVLAEDVLDLIRRELGLPAPRTRADRRKSQSNY